jgi:hypothetical protein
MSATADTIYRVVTVYDAETSKAESGWGRLATVFDHVINLAKEAKGFLGEIIETVTHLGSAAENASISIAGLLNASGMPHANNFNTALKMSSAIIDQMRKDAAALPGTFEDLQEIFTRSIPGAGMAGKSTLDAEHLSGQMMAVGKTFGMQAEFIGREFSELMEGRASSRVTLFAKLRQFMGPDMDAAKFNALSAPERWERIAAALSKFQPMIDKYGESWDAISSTTESYIQNLYRIGSGALFKGIEQRLAALNAWYEKNQTQIDKMVQDVGGRLATALIDAFEAVKSAVMFVVEHRDAIIGIGEAIAAAFAMSKLGGAMDMKGAGSALAGILNPTVGGAGVFNLAAGGAMGYAMARLTGQTDLLSQASSTLLGAFTALPGPLGMVAQGLFAFQQAMASFVDDTAREGVMLKGDIGDPVSIYKRYEAGGSKLTQAVADDMAGYLKAHGIARAEGGIDSRKLTEFLMLGVSTGTFDVSGAAAFRKLALATAAGGFVHKNGEGQEFGPGNAGALTPEQRIQQFLAERGRPVQPHNITNIGAINLYNNIYDAEDPARVLQHLTAKAVRDNLERPTQSPSVPVHR